MEQLFFKKFKLNQLQQIKQIYSNIYIFRYNDLNTNENIYLKKQLKKLNLNSMILKQNLIHSFFPNLKGQGALLLIYNNHKNLDTIHMNLNSHQILIKNLNKIPKIEFIYFQFQHQIYTKLKLEKILLNSKISLNKSLIQPLLIFLYSLRKASIT